MRSAFLPEPSLSEDRRQLTFHLPPSDEWDHAVGVDFDLDASATRLDVDARLAGKHLPAGRLLLGEKHAPAAGLPARVSPGDGVGEAGAAHPVGVRATTAQAHIYLWETRLPGGAALALSESELDALRALGYVH